MVRLWAFERDYLMNTNSWNRLRYTLYAPFYDAAIQALDESRQRAIGLLGLCTNERVLIVGAGTGEDLRYIPPEVEVVATDITPAMVEQIRAKAALLNRTITARVMDGQSLTFASGQFDAVVLNLIVAVIPDPVACMREAARVLKPGGRIVIFDKFLREEHSPSVMRRALDLVIGILATNINRKLEPILDSAALCIDHQEPAVKYSRLGFTIALLRKC